MAMNVITKLTLVITINESTAGGMFVNATGQFPLDSIGRVGQILNYLHGIIQVYIGRQLGILVRDYFNRCVTTYTAAVISVY